MTISLYAYLTAALLLVLPHFPDIVGGGKPEALIVKCANTQSSSGMWNKVSEWCQMSKPSKIPRISFEFSLPETFFFLSVSCVLLPTLNAIRRKILFRKFTYLRLEGSNNWILLFDIFRLFVAKNSDNEDKVVSWHSKVKQVKKNKKLFR